MGCECHFMLTLIPKMISHKHGITSEEHYLSVRHAAKNRSPDIENICHGEIYISPVVKGHECMASLITRW